MHLILTGSITITSIIMIYFGASSHFTVSAFHEVTGSKVVNPHKTLQDEINFAHS